MDDPDVHQYVQERLKNYWSPDQIAGRVRRDFPRAPSWWLSDQTIYDWIRWRTPGWRKLLRRGGRPPEKRGKLTDVVRIGGRPDVINRRRRYGDWEGDTLVGKGRRSALITLVERKSGYVRIGRVDSMKSDVTARVVKQRMKELPPALRRSMTFDNVRSVHADRLSKTVIGTIVRENVDRESRLMTDEAKHYHAVGKEFAEHHQLTRRSGLQIYFADPYASWQRGTNENTNGLLRQYFPKGTDFTRISHDEVARVEQSLNERPRKRLGYRTPDEILKPRMCRN